MLADLRAGLGEDLVAERHQLVFPAQRYLAREAVQEVAPPFTEVQDSRRDSIGMEREADAVDRRLQQLRRDAVEQRTECPVGGDQIPPSVDGDRRVWLVAGEYVTQGVANRRELEVIERPRVVLRRVAGREQSWLRSRSGTWSRSARCSSISGLGRERPVSTKLKCLVETPASSARSS